MNDTLYRELLELRKAVKNDQRFLKEEELLRKIQEDVETKELLSKLNALLSDGSLAENLEIHSLKQELDAKPLVSEYNKIKSANDFLRLKINDLLLAPYISFTIPEVIK